LRGEKTVDSIRGNVGARENLLRDFLDAIVQLARLGIAGFERLDIVLKADML
jgi:porphobilinogen deaminase